MSKKVQTTKNCGISGGRHLNLEKILQGRKKIPISRCKLEYNRKTGKKRTKKSLPASRKALSVVLSIGYLLLRSFRHTLQMFFPLKETMSRESPQKMQAGWYLLRMIEEPST